MRTSSPLHYQSSGRAGAVTIVFLHGGGASGWMWQPVTDLLPEYHCLVPDLPEQGKSMNVSPFSMELAAEKTADLIRDQARGGRAVVVGLSEGAQAAVQLLANEPDLVERAVVSSALLRPLPGAGWASSPGLLAWTYRLSVAPFMKSDFWIRLNMKYSAGIPDRFYPQFKQSFQEMTEGGFVNLMVANQRFRLPGGLENARLPCLVVVGSKEYAAMKESARDLARALPDATSKQVDLGREATLAQEHNWAMTAPALFADTVRAWVEGALLPGELKGL